MFLFLFLINEVVRGLRHKDAVLNTARTFTKQVSNFEPPHLLPLDKHFTEQDERVTEGG